METFEWREPFAMNNPNLSRACCHVAICSKCGFHYATLETRDDTRKPRDLWYVPSTGLCPAHSGSRSFFGHPQRMLPLFTYYPNSLERMALLPQAFLVREFLFLLETINHERKTALDFS